jgi:hypothetical protein
MATTIPEEYLSYDYGFSAVDDPAEAVEKDTTPVKAEMSEDVGNKLEDIEDKIQSLTSLMFRMEEGQSERVSEAELRDKVRQLESIIVPLLNNLLKTSAKPYIHWPNRKEICEKQLEKVLEITRG